MVYSSYTNEGDHTSNAKIKLTQYDSLNKDDPLRLEGINFDELAERIVSMNYGAQRILSALIRAMRKSDYDRDTQIADTLEAAFEQ